MSPQPGGGADSLQSAAWPDMFDSLQAAYAQLNETQFELERRVTEVEETRELLERVIDSMSEALLMADSSGRILLINRAAGELLGMQPTDAVGRPLGAAWSGAAIPTTPWELTEQAPGGTVSDLQVSFPGRHGEVRHASVSCALLRDKFGAINGLLVVARDVTVATRRAEAQRFLAEASALLVRSLSARRTLRDLARMCVPRLADWCVVAVRGRSGGMRLVAAHPDPDQDRRLGALLHNELRDASWSPALDAALASGEIVLEEGSPFASMADADAEALNRRFPGDATIAVPLVARGRAVGAIGLVWNGRPPGQRMQALELAEELAQRAALAIDNAQLHEAERRSRRSAQTVAERLRRVQSVTDAALVHLDLDGLLASLLERIADNLEIDVASVLLFDEDRYALIPLAVHGMPDDDRDEVPLEQGYLGRVASERRALAIEDADPAELSMPSLRRQQITSLCGVPLLLEGRMTGVLVVGSRARRSFTTADMTLLRLVADRAALAIENSRLYERQRTIAGTLQRSLLPHVVGRIRGLELAARYLPSGAGLDVGGDWYDVIALPEGRAGVAVGDVGGRGIPAAATMGQLRTALRTYAFEGFSPARALERLNLLSADTESLFATVVYLVIDPATGRMRYASAGHLPPLLLEPDGSIRWLEGGRWLPLGVRPPVAGAQEDEVDLRPGATLLLYTDGLIERRTSSIDAGMERLAESIRRAPAGLEALLDHVLEDLLADEQAGSDDVAVLALRMAPRPVAELRASLPADASGLRETRQALSDWLLEAGVPPPTRYDLVLAAGEVCANAVEHPRQRSSPVIETGATFGDDGWITITVRDYGTWKPQRVQPTRGFGLRIARELTDEVSIERSREGTAVTLRHRVAAGGNGDPRAPDAAATRGSASPRRRSSPD